MLAAAVGGGLVLAVIAALIGARFLAPGAGAGTIPGAGSSARPGTTGTAQAIGTFGIATTTSNCPAASVPGAGARCPKDPECWNGLFEAEGIITAPSALPCTGPHTWQTFAIALMPADASTFNVNILQSSPAVRAVCSFPVLLRSRAGQARLIPRGRWSIQVLPPDEAAYDSGVRTYRCLAALGYAASRTSQFGP